MPEFTMLEWYAANNDYQDMMGVCEDLVGFVAKVIGFGNTLPYQGKTISLGKPWGRLSVGKAFEKYASISLQKALTDDLFDEVMTDEIEPFLGNERPVFLYDYPAQRASLARLRADDQRYGERFELYISGIEICNAFSELVNAREQRQRFEAEALLRSQLGKTKYPLPEIFLDMLDDMPEAAGNALGLDRLIMLFADAASIDDVVAFVPEDL